jgi:DNA-binding SARP family transcriptional activator
VSAHGIVELGLAADVDVTDLIDRAHAVLNGAADPVAPVDGGVGPGELLPDWDDPWLDAERERLHQLRLHVLEAAARQLADQGHYGLALESALAALRADDLRESAHRAVISIHLAEGNVAEARRAFDLCRRTFVEELGIEPSSVVAAMLARDVSSHGRGSLHSVTRDA